MLEECRTLLLNIVLQVDVDDGWTWFPDQIVGYTVRGAYQILTDKTPFYDCVFADLIWRKEVPLKVSVFAWRLFWNRLPTKVNLFQRGIIPHETQLCVGGCGLQETENHMFLTCPLFGQIWHLVRHWLGVYSANPSTILDHCLQFGSSSDYAKSRCSFMSVIWFASSWVIWKEKDDRLFVGKEKSPFQLLEIIKLLSFWWFKVNFVIFNYSFHNWCHNPPVCVGIG